MKLDNLFGLVGRPFSAQFFCALAAGAFFLSPSFSTEVFAHASGVAHSHAPNPFKSAVPTPAPAPVNPPPANSTGGLQFNFFPAPGGDLSALLSSTNPADVALGNNVVQGFAAAGNLWSGIFNDSITVNIEIDFPALGPNILGQAGSNTVGRFYTDVRNSLIADSSSVGDATAVANLQPAGSLDFITNNTSIAAAPRIRDNDGSGNNNTIDINRANAKALGLLGATDPGIDAEISFSSDFTWDFTRPEITSNTFDFVGVAAHEIGHALGFVSGVDTVDFVTPAGQAAAGGPGPTDLDGFRIFSVLDLFRYSDDSLSQSGQPATGAVLDLAFGEVPGDTPFFSIDGGATSLATFATGSFNGDGQQASHWEDNLGFGILDPTFSPAEFGDITGLDILALDVIGFDLVPEPSSMLLVFVGLTFACAGGRRRV